MNLDILRSKYEKQFKNHQDLSAAELKYQEMVSGIRGIANTDGLREIRDYWLREYQMHSEELSNRPKNVELVLERFIMAKNFLDFLNNIMSKDVVIPK